MPTDEVRICSPTPMILASLPASLGLADRKYHYSWSKTDWICTTR